jgi:hypothetical protein
MPAHDPARAHDPPAQEPVPAVLTGTDRAILAASVVVATLAVCVRIHNVGAYPALNDWDGAGHAVNVVDLSEGHWPNPRSWSGSHPPLYYGMSAALWALLPDGVPIHVMMRLLTASAWVGTVALVWRVLRRLVSQVDAAVVAVVLLGVPGFMIASSMMTNDALCTFFVTAALVRLIGVPRDTMPTAGHGAMTGMLAGLAALTKAQGLAAVAAAGAWYAWRGRRDPKAALRTLVAFGVISAAVAGAHYGRLFLSLSGSTHSVIVGYAGSQEKDAIATVVHAVWREGTTHSIAWWFHTALWGDPTAVFLPPGVDGRWLASLVWTGGLLVIPVGVAGLIGVLTKRRDVLRAAGAAFLFGAAYTAFLLGYAVTYPYFILPKTSFMLPEALPSGIALAVGLSMCGAGARTLLRVLLLAVATGGIALTTYGWWEAAPPDSRPHPPAAAASGPALAVERWFRDRATDPVRTVPLLAPETQLERGLTAVGVLGLPPLPPEVGLSAEDERSLALARARVAWLSLYDLIPWMQPVAGALGVEVLAADERGDAANVRVRVTAVGTAPPAGGEIGLWPFPPFEQDFALERRDGAWRITRMTQTNVVAENALQAFVAAPSQAGLDGLLALGWEPPWQKAIASVLHPKR